MKRTIIPQDSIPYDSHTTIEKLFQLLQKDKDNSELQQQFIQSIKKSTQKSEQLARELHKNDRYGNNEYYYDAHLAPVKEKAIQLALDNGFSLEEIKMVAIVADLHDAIEDGHISYAKLSTIFGKTIAGAVEILNKREDPKEEKQHRKEKKDYYYCIAKNKITKIVKAADAALNIKKTTLLDDKEKATYHLLKCLGRQREYADANIMPEILAPLLYELYSTLFPSLSSNIKGFFNSKIVPDNSSEDILSDKLDEKLQRCKIFTYKDLLRLYAGLNPNKKNNIRSIQYQSEKNNVTFDKLDVQEIEELLDSFYKKLWEYTK